MRPRFLADADLNHKIVVGLRRREPSIDFAGAREGGVVGRPDPEVIGIAADSGRILISHDRKTMPGHFSRFRETRSSAGIILVSQDLEVGTAIEDLLLIWAATDSRVAQPPRLHTAMMSSARLPCSAYPRNGHLN